MALRHGDEYYTKWTHVENGNVLTRRLHRIEIQARDGRLYVIKGENLPDFLLTNSGHGYKGCHVAQILLSPKSAASGMKWPRLPETLFWPTWRDIFHVGLGFVAFGVLNALGSATAAAF